MPGPGRPAQAAHHVGRDPASALLHRPPQVTRHPVVAQPDATVGERGHRQTDRGADAGVHQAGARGLAERQRPEEAAVEVDQPVHAVGPDEELQLHQPAPPQSAQQLLAAPREARVDGDRARPRGRAGRGREKPRRHLLHAAHQPPLVHHPDQRREVPVDRLLQHRLVPLQPEGEQVVGELGLGAADLGLDPVPAVLLRRPVPPVLDHHGQGGVSGALRRQHPGGRRGQVDLAGDLGEHHLVHARGHHGLVRVRDRRIKSVAVVGQRGHPVVPRADDHVVAAGGQRPDQPGDEGLLVAGGTREQVDPLDRPRGPDESPSRPGRTDPHPPPGAVQRTRRGDRPTVAAVCKDQHRDRTSACGGHGAYRSGRM